MLWAQLNQSVNGAILYMYSLGVLGARSPKGNHTFVSSNPTPLGFLATDLLPRLDAPEWVHQTILDDRRDAGEEEQLGQIQVPPFSRAQ
jgi:hypothetical protein